MRYVCQNCPVYLSTFGYLGRPANSCLRCWFHFFNQNTGAAHAAQYAIETLGRDAAVKTKGEKYVKMFERWLKDKHDSGRSTKKLERQDESLGSNL